MFEHTFLATRLFNLMHVKHTIPYLYIHPSSRRWNLSFEMCRSNCKWKCYFRKYASCWFILCTIITIYGAKKP